MPHVFNIRLALDLISGFSEIVFGFKQ